MKAVVKVLQGMSITRGAALSGDVIGAFFEEILRSGFKQDKGMYFTHADLVTFMLEAIGLDGLTVQTWRRATHPENRLPYVVDPACGSGSFLLRAMEIMGRAVREARDALVADAEAEQFFNARMSDSMPNYWAEQFIYGLDPKFIMAITTKVNMVLHGDGSAHVFKYDALRPLATFADEKLRPLGDEYRSIPKSRYKPEMCESFDAVVSNPPFGITLAQETRASLGSTFTLAAPVSSEVLFLERWFQLLKPGGRLSVVVPESLLNVSETTEARLFLYRGFWIRCIVSLPRNLFIETPTLTSLLFAQKKTRDEIATWDRKWEAELARCKDKVRLTELFLREQLVTADVSVEEVERKVLATLEPVVDRRGWVASRGRAPTSWTLPIGTKQPIRACEYYLGLLRSPSLKLTVRNYVFREVAASLDYEYPVYAADEVGYKLSKRKERVRPNQLCRFIGVNTRTEFPNLHLATEPVLVQVDVEHPERILDYIRRDVRWS